MSTQLPHLSQPQAAVLARWSYGIVFTRCCGLSTVAVFLAALLNKGDSTVREQLREWERAAADKPGVKRGTKRQEVALDATTLGDRFVVLALSVAARGLYARGLFRASQQRGWHPFLRITLGGRVRPAGRPAFMPLGALVPTLGSEWCGRVTCFATPDCQLDCTLVARWEAGYRDPWLLLTDLAPAAAEAAWYRLRGWSAAGFKDLKRGAGSGRTPG